MSAKSILEALQKAHDPGDVNTTQGLQDHIAWHEHALDSLASYIDSKIKDRPAKVVPTAVKRKKKL